MWSTLPPQFSSFHSGQACYFSKEACHHWKKPAVTKPSEWKELVKLANEHQVYLFEAARNYQEAAFQVVKKLPL